MDKKQPATSRKISALGELIMSHLPDLEQTRTHGIGHGLYWTPRNARSARGSNFRRRDAGGQMPT